VLFQNYSHFLSSIYAYSEPSASPLPTEDETTRGIDVHHYEFVTSGNRTFRLNVWDFGGQQIYHATHQFFLTKSSLYVLVDDTRKDHKSIHDEGFKYWLEVVEALSERSPVLIFQNEKGGRSKKIDEAGIRGRFPNVLQTYRGDLDKADSAKELRQAIEFHTQNLPHIGDEVPAKWVTIRAAIEQEAKDKPYISQDRYFEIYRGYLDFDRTKALHLSRYFHDLGVFLHFQDDLALEKTVILQNRWATEAVFKILDDEEVKNKLGHFTLEDCRRLWASSEYEDKHLELLALMAKFELCYLLADTSRETWLAPQLLSPSKPGELEDWADPADLVLCYRYKFLPKGMISRLMVRMHRFVKQPERSWTTGVLFQHEQTQVLVEVTTQGDEIVLRARGPENKALLSVIVSDLDALNASFRGLEDKVGKWVPCICEKCVGATSPELFEQMRLFQRKRDNKLTIECPTSYSDVSVLELLDGLKLEQLPRWAAEPAKEKEIRIFLASSKELREDRDAFDLYIRQQNDQYRKQGLYLEIVRWENFLGSMSETRRQDEYNKKVRDCDIFVSLFMTKTGKFTEEEFDVAHQAFMEKGKPLVYTFFKEAKVSISTVDKNDLASLRDFQEKLKNYGHFYTQYESTEHLKRLFKDQIEKLRDEGKL
ncbi:COR domain-containing protein, partial [Planctomycetota bacterium]